MIFKERVKDNKVLMEHINTKLMIIGPTKDMSNEDFKDM